MDTDSSGVIHLWEQCLLLLGQDLKGTAGFTYLKACRPIEYLETDMILVLEAGDEYAREWLESRLQIQANRSIGCYIPGATIRFEALTNPYKQDGTLDLGVLWRLTTGRIRSRIGEGDYKTWIESASIAEYIPEIWVIKISANNTFTISILRERFSAILKEAISEILKHEVVLDFGNLSNGKQLEEESIELSALDMESLSGEDSRLLDREVVIPGYARRLAVEIGPKPILLWTGFRQAFYQAGDQDGYGITKKRRVWSGAIQPWTTFEIRTYWNQLKKCSNDGLMDGLISKVSRERTYNRSLDGHTHALPNAYQVHLTPRLTKEDVNAIHKILLQEFNSTKSIRKAIQKLLDMDRVTLVGQLPTITELKNIIEPKDNKDLFEFCNLYSITDIVQSITSSEHLYPELIQACGELHKKIVRLWGTMHISHLFLLRSVPQLKLTPSQVWLIMVARDMAYENIDNKEYRLDITFEKGYQEMTTLCGLSEASWKGVRAWFDGNGDGGEISQYMTETTENIEGNVFNCPRSFRVRSRYEEP